MPISFKNYKKFINANKSMTPKSRKKAIDTYKKNLKGYKKNYD